MYEYSYVQPFAMGSYDTIELLLEDRTPITSAWRRYHGTEHASLFECVFRVRVVKHSIS